MHNCGPTFPCPQVFPSGKAQSSLSSHSSFRRAPRLNASCFLSPQGLVRKLPLVPNILCPLHPSYFALSHSPLTGTGFSTGSPGSEASWDKDPVPARLASVQLLLPPPIFCESLQLGVYWRRVWGGGRGQPPSGHELWKHSLSEDLSALTLWENAGRCPEKARANSGPPAEPNQEPGHLPSVRKAEELINTVFKSQAGV